MIIFRLKEIDFSRRDDFPNELLDEFLPSEKILGDKPLRLDIEWTGEFSMQYNNSTPLIQAKIKAYIKELTLNPASKFIDTKDKTADTHYLADFSNISTSKVDERFVMFSKNLTASDRFNYRVYKPRLVKENEETYFSQKIVLSTCQGHTISGKPGSYVGGDNTGGNVYHPVSKAEKRRRKEEKRQKQQNKNKGR